MADALAIRYNLADELLAASDAPVETLAVSFAVWVLNEQLDCKASSKVSIYIYDVRGKKMTTMIHNSHCRQRHSVGDR